MFIISWSVYVMLKWKWNMFTQQISRISISPNKSLCKGFVLVIVRECCNSPIPSSHIVSGYIIEKNKHVIGMCVYTHFHIYLSAVEDSVMCQINFECTKYVSWWSDHAMSNRKWNMFVCQISCILIILNKIWRKDFVIVIVREFLT